jgi:hypothetical protein
MTFGEMFGYLARLPVWKSVGGEFRNMTNNRRLSANPRCGDKQGKVAMTLGHGVSLDMIDMAHGLYV